MRKIFIILFIFSLLASTAEATIKIGLTLGLTGKYSEMSDKQMKGFKLWERDVNSRGGILGKKVRVIIYDDKSEPRTAKAIYEHLILKDHVDFLFSPYSSEITEAILPVTEKYGYPILISGASADRLWQRGYKYIFGVYTPASRYTEGFIEVVATHGFTKVAIVYADDPFSEDSANGTKKSAEMSGLKVLLFEKFRKGAQRLEALAEKIKSFDARVLIVCGHFNEAVDILLSLKKIRWHPMAYYATVGPATRAFYNRLQADAEYVFTTSHWVHQNISDSPDSRAFYESYLKVYDEEPSYHSATAYAAGEILEAAIKKTRGFFKDKIRDNLFIIETSSIIGRYGVDKTGRQIKHLPFVIQWQNGEKEIVWPEEKRTAKPMFRF
ncbi:MAG: hypothetical protein C0415_00340 [Thermodesulfovibrio sp.]|nr:hypothetical protein [Thermodesulfovibrio sp.]